MHVWMPVIRTGTGAEVWADQLAEGLRARGHAVTLDKVPHRFQYAPWLSGLRAPAGADVTLANSWSAAAFARPAPLAVVVHHVVHDPAMRAFKSPAQRIFHAGFVRPMERAALRAAAKVIAVSESTAAALRAHLLPVPVEVALNGVDTGFFTPAPGADAPRAPGPMRLLSVGKPSRRKGFDVTAAIMARLGDRAELTIVGGGAPEIAPPPGARRLGRVDAEGLRDAYRAADFLLFPSRQEGFGLVAAEAMACGTPVLCLSGGAVEEVAAPPACGIAVPPARAEDLGDAALAALADAPAHAAMRRAARARAVEAFDAGRWLTQMERILAAAAATR
ncbi:glycosyltransferase family 4 protein [Rhodovulum sp. DZ06]|uniref:glycosyltransferase family 4 protein n=1 Tax=Rhodovulum sp. DZ06 TaxID=3425126 RepID=UPI003D34DFE9